jgi:DNA-binding NarL/FixJ family response regulator
LLDQIGPAADGPRIEGLAGSGVALKQLRVVVADDHKLIVEAVRTAFAAEDDIEVVGAAANGVDALRLVAQKSPDVLLLDLRMPLLGGLAVLEQVHQQGLAVKVIVLSVTDDPETIELALQAGAAAVLNKQIDPSTLAGIVRAVAAGAVFRPASLPARDSIELTKREREIIAGLAAGDSNCQIARALWVSEQTVKYHLTKIYRKLGVKSRTEAMVIIFAHQLIRPDARSGLTPGRG